MLTVTSEAVFELLRAELGNLVFQLAVSRAESTEAQRQLAAALAENAELRKAAPAPSNVEPIRPEAVA